MTQIRSKFKPFLYVHFQYLLSSNICIYLYIYTYKRNYSTSGAMDGKLLIINEAHSAEFYLVIIILYPTSPRRILFLLKTQGSTTIPCCFYSGPKHAFDGHFISDAFLDHVGTAGVWTDSLCPTSQWKCYKSDIYIYYI